MRHEILSSRPPKKALIATMPKAGTWFCHSFFHCYAAWLSYTDPFLESVVANRGITHLRRPDLTRALRKGRIKDLTHPRALGVQTLCICHSICPGYRSAADPLREDWNRLRFYVDGYNYGERLLGKNFEALNPAQNPGATIIYLFRNPLDEMVSYWRHVQHHIDPRQRMKVSKNGQVSSIMDFRDFVFHASALDSFIKQFSTFRTVHLRFPENVLMVPYECLVADPAEWFTRMLQRMNHPVAGRRRQWCFKQALRMTAQEAMMKVEDTIGRSLANDQTLATERHVRDGRVGKWGAWYTEYDIEQVERRLRAFGLSLKDFVLSPQPKSYAKPVADFDLEKRQHGLRSQLAQPCCGR